MTLQVVAGIGSEDRGDDGVGIEVARRVAGAATDLGPLGEPLELLGRWDRADLAVVVDATRSKGRRPGTVSSHVLLEPGTPPRDPGAGDPVTAAEPLSTHGFDLLGVLRLAVALGTAPSRVVLVAVEGARFDPGRGLSPAVLQAVPGAAREVLGLLAERP